MLPFINNVVKSGEYRKRITINNDKGVVSTNPNDLGAVTANVKPFAQCWAKISNTKGREYQLGLQVVGESTDIVEIRYIKGVTVEMQVSYVDDRTNSVRTLDINNITDPDERHIKLVMFCTEATSAGAG